MPDEAPVILPKSSAEVRALFERELRAPPKAALSNPQDLERRAAVVRRAHRLARPLAILVVDDEPLYAEGIRAHLLQDPEIAALVHVTLVSSPNAALEVCKEKKFDLVICDVDLGPAELSGFELVAGIRERLEMVRICIHSNRHSTADYRESVQVDADAFLPKPMSAAHLWGLLASE